MASIVVPYTWKINVGTGDGTRTATVENVLHNVQKFLNKHRRPNEPMRGVYKTEMNGFLVHIGFNGRCFEVAIVCAGDGSPERQQVVKEEGWSPVLTFSCDYHVQSIEVASLDGCRLVLIGSLGRHVFYGHKFVKWKAQQLTRRLQKLERGSG
ncbi:hypothetical protein OAM67_01480 [bacterium]|nr:hypothetical protein [bacterium]